MNPLIKIFILAFMLVAETRLKKGKEIESLFRHGKRFENEQIIIKILRKKKAEGPRFVFVASTKISKKAAVRNQIKRLFREIVRINFKKIKKGFDVAIVAKEGSKKKKYRELEGATLRLMEKAGLTRIINN